MKHLEKQELWSQIKKQHAGNSNTFEMENKGQENEANPVESNNAAVDNQTGGEQKASTQPEVESSTGDAQIDSTPDEGDTQDNLPTTEPPADSSDPIESSPDTSSLEPEADTPPINPNRWDTAKDYKAAAMHAYGFEFDLVPMLPGTTDLAVERESWIDGLSPRKISEHWGKNPDHELGLIVGDDLIVFGADSPESITALAKIEARHELTPMLVVKTNTGEEHYFRRPAGTIVRENSQGTEKHPDHLRITTGQSCVTVPPSPGKIFTAIRANDKKELSEATQEVIDAVCQYNDGVVPSQPKNLAAQEEPEDTLSQESEPEANTVNIESSPDTSALVTPQGSQLAHKQPSCIDNPQPLDSKLFPNQPRGGNSNQLPATIANLRYMLKKYGISVRDNVIKKNFMIILPGQSGSIDSMDDVAMTHIISLANLNGLNTSQMPFYVKALADENLYNPVADWILSKPWDGTDRKKAICETITVQEGYPMALRDVLICKWLLSAVAAALKQNGFKTRGVLVLQGRQGLGKTSWVRSLVPDSHLGDMVVKVDHHLDISIKDTILGAISHWIVEIGELDSSFKKDISRLKGFLTSDFDKVRQPYARKASVYPRQTVFIATVNQPDFLRDDTGNSRWWTIPATKINYEHGIDMQQLFAQLAVDLNKGKKWWLTQEEEAQLNSCNIEHQSVSVIRERLLEYLDPDLIGKDGNPAMTASKVLAELGVKNATNSQCRECGAILRELLGDPKKIRGLQKWRIPRKRDNSPLSSFDDDDDMY